jgi:hypothetical protein
MFSSLVSRAAAGFWPHTKTGACTKLRRCDKEEEMELDTSDTSQSRPVRFEAKQSKCTSPQLRPPRALVQVNMGLRSSWRDTPAIGALLCFCFTISQLEVIRGYMPSRS